MTGMKQQIKRVSGRLLACALCLCVLLCALPAALAADGGASLVVRSDKSEYGLKDDELLVDVYYVGSPVLEGYQAYPPYGDGLLSWESNEELEELGNIIAGIAFDKATPIIRGRKGGTVIDRNDENALLPSGLYLVVVRGVGIEEYVHTIKVDGKTRYLTSVENASYHFDYMPMLVMLKAGEEPYEVKPKADVTPTPTPPTPTTPTKPTPDKPPLPRTGQLWWPVFVMLPLGVVLLAVGLFCLLGRKKQGRDRKEP